MNFNNCLVLLACLSAVSAATIRGVDHRKLAPLGKSAVCRKVQEENYETRYVNDFQYFIMSLQRGEFPPRVKCDSICATFCKGFSSFDSSSSNCRCLGSAASVATVCGKNAALSGTKCLCSPGYEGDANKECTKIVDACLEIPCASNQKCANTAGSFTCTPILCANPAGNLCGPSSACKDTPTGFSCTSLLDSDICPAGCGPDSLCVSGKCVCDAGFHRPDPNLGCVVVDACLSKPCSSNQICSTQAGSYTCEPIKCANPFGNPCGTASACSDSPSGFTCKSLLGPEICPAGCGPDSSCISGKCECDSGFYRPDPNLGCEAIKP